MWLSQSVSLWIFLYSEHHVDSPDDYTYGNDFEIFNLPEQKAWWPLTVQVILANGAEIDAKHDYNDTALILAAKYNRLHIVEALVSSGRPISSQPIINLFCPNVKVHCSRMLQKYLTSS